MLIAKEPRMTRSKAQLHVLWCGFFWLGSGRGVFGTSYMSLAHQLKDLSPHLGSLSRVNFQRILSSRTTTTCS